MASNIRSFSLALDRYATERVPDLVAQRHRAIHLEALRRVVLKTPVDTGRARGNWQSSVDEPAAGTLDVTDKDGGPTIARESAVIATVKPFSVSWLVNNLPYAQRLEDGYSKQAPGGMVAVTVAEIEAGLGR